MTSKKAKAPGTAGDISTTRHSREGGLCFTSAEPNIQGFNEA
jgi:hypothetical protein